jgi:hypothetical protein
MDPGGLRSRVAWVLSIGLCICDCVRATQKPRKVGRAEPETAPVNQNSSMGSQNWLLVCTMASNTRLWTVKDIRCVSACVGVRSRGRVDVETVGSRSRYLRCLLSNTRIVATVSQRGCAILRCLHQGNPAALDERGRKRDEQRGQRRRPDVRKLFTFPMVGISRRAQRRGQDRIAASYPRQNKHGRLGCQAARGLELGRGGYSRWMTESRVVCIYK